MQMENNINWYIIYNYSNSPQRSMQLQHLNKSFDSKGEL